MDINDLDIDWDYLLERLERLMDMGEEYLTLQLAEYQLDPEAFEEFVAFRWQREGASGYLVEVAFPDLPAPSDLLGLDRVLARLRQNTLQFVKGLPANSVLLWGERGSGKSSAVKSLLQEFSPQKLRLVEVKKEDLLQLPAITTLLRDLPHRFILFCDDLSFTEADTGCRELQALLDGGIEARPENVLVYATSNRRHLMPEQLAENTGAVETHPEETMAEKLSLSDHFGITLGFYPMDQETYLAIVRHLAGQRQLQLAREELEAEARQWALNRGARSGRVARQFVDDLTGRLALQGKIGPPPA